MAKIAISYRRSDSQDITGRIFDRLVEQYGKRTVFRDIDSIRPGTDYRTQITDAMKATDVLLIILGPRWLGRVAGVESRIDSEADPVRIEVETALKRDIPIIPVLVGGMKMPEPSDLPASLSDLVYRQAVTVDSGRDFDYHIEGLIRALDEFFAAKGIAPPDPHTGSEEVTPASGTAAAADMPPSSSMRTYWIAGGIAAVVLVAAAIVLQSRPQHASSPAMPAANPTPVSTTILTPPPVNEAASAWAVTKDSTSIAELQDFIRQFGDTPYGSMARARVQELLKSQASAVAQPIVPVPQAPPMTQPVAPPPQALTAYIPTSASPSFDCSKARAPDEIEVCRNGELSYLDRQLDVTFVALRGRLDRDQQATLMDEEKAWLKQRAACYSDDACLRDAYKSRLAQLRTWQ